MRDYFLRLTFVNAAVAVLCFAAAYFFEITNVMFFGALIALFLLRFLLGKDKEERMRIWKMRRKVFAASPRLKWFSIAAGFVLPIICGFAAYSAFGASYNNALIWFLGATHLGALITNWFIFPRLERQIVDHFD